MTIEIINVLTRTDKVKYAIIPKKSAIQGGEKILVTNNLKMINKILKEEKDGRERS